MVKNASITKSSAKATKVKLEPEFVAVNDEAADDSFGNNVEIKEEPIDSRSYSLTNGESIDINPYDPIHTLDANRALGNGAQLSNNVAVKTLSCGNIVMETTSDGVQTYKLICDHCKATFSTTIENFWPNFVKHINDAHIPTPPRLPTPESKKVAIENITKAQTIDEAVKEVEVAGLENDLETEKVENTSNEANADINYDEDDSFNGNTQDFEDSDWEDETFGPKKKRQKTAYTTNKTKIAQNIKSENSNDADKKQKTVNIISFDHPDKNCVITFLELITSRAILWLPRQSIMKRFDEALVELTSKFNEFFPHYGLTKEQMRLSVKAVKDMYQRLTDSEKQNENKSGTKRRSKNCLYKTKYPEYFELCSEIEENSKNILQICDICQTTFYNPQDLQVHKYKKHKIGELPYKCQRCCYGFACAEKLAAHEEKHNRVKSFKCSQCGQGFYAENKLQAHMALHTDDSKQICEICGKKFPSLTKYRRHKLHHEAPKEKCEICGKLYFEKWTLSEHIKSHKNERQYRCDICGKTFNRQEGVTIHKRGVHKIKTQTKKYVWVNRVTSAMSNTENAAGDGIEGDSQNELDAPGDGDKSVDMQNTNSNSTTFSSSAVNDETTAYDVKPTLAESSDNNASTRNQQNIFPFEILTSLLN